MPSNLLRFAVSTCECETTEPRHLGAGPKRLLRFTGLLCFSNGLDQVLESILTQIRNSSAVPILNPAELRAEVLRTL